MKNIRIFLSENFQFLVVKFSVYLNSHVFVMTCIFIENSEKYIDNIWFRKVPYLEQSKTYFKTYSETPRLMRLDLQKLVLSLVFSTVLFSTALFEV